MGLGQRARISFHTMRYIRLLLCCSFLCFWSKSVWSDQDIYLDIETSMGVVGIVVYPDRAPVSVENFLRYVESDRYDGMIIHRVVPDYIIQTGGYRLGLEIIESFEGLVKNESLNGLKNVYGSIALARGKNSHGATSQFFFNLADNDHLNATHHRLGYSVFGKVVSNIELLHKISHLESIRKGVIWDYPKREVIVKDIVIVDKKS